MRGRTHREDAPLTSTPRTRGPDLTGASRTAIAYYRRKATAARAGAAALRAETPPALHEANLTDELADLWTALADELEAFAAGSAGHPDQGELL